MVRLKRSVNQKSLFIATTKEDVIYTGNVYHATTKGRLRRMKPPFNGDKEKILKEFKGRIFYCVYTEKAKAGRYVFKPCVLNGNVDWTKAPYVNFIDENFNVSKNPRFMPWEKLYDGYTEAKKICDHCNNMYKRSFQNEPYVTLNTLEHHKTKMIYIQRQIAKKLKDYPNFMGVSFSDVHANGIQINGNHSEIEGYHFVIVTVDYDFENVKEAIEGFVESWKAKDNPKAIEDFKKFIADGIKWGFD